ncbi:MAG: hypothetical protein K2R98_29375 [Gemmataceae bacterium]|nr:hypothetical protein [Gemmataceae bacterium]
MEILWVVAYLAAAIVGHAIAMRLSGRGDSVTRFAMVGGFIGLGLSVHALFFDSLPCGGAALVVYAFACELYVFLFTLVGTSVSVGILLKLANGPHSRSEIAALYDAPSMVRGRVERMRAVGLLGKDGFPSSQGKRLVALFLTLKRIFRHPIPGCSSDRKETASALPHSFRI